MSRMVPEKLFPQTKPFEPIYLERHSWFRYAFYIASTALMSLIFLSFVIYNFFWGTISPTEYTVAIIGTIGAPLIPLLWVFRYFRSGYAVTNEAIHLKQGFLFGQEVKIRFVDIKRIKPVKEKKFFTIEMGHFSLEPKSGHPQYLVDVKSPATFYSAVRKGMGLSS